MMPMFVVKLRCEETLNVGIKLWDIYGIHLIYKI